MEILHLVCSTFKSFQDFLCSCIWYSSIKMFYGEKFNFWELLFLHSYLVFLYVYLCMFVFYWQNVHTIYKHFAVSYIIFSCCCSWLVLVNYFLQMMESVLDYVVRVGRCSLVFVSRLFRSFLRFSYIIFTT